MIERRSHLDRRLSRLDTACSAAAAAAAAEVRVSGWRDGDIQAAIPSGAGVSALDLDDGLWLARRAACAVAGLVAIGYVIYMAPVLLAEVALDAAIISVLYRRLRRDEQGHWLTTVFRHTWVPAVVLVVFAFVAGFALQQAAPDARSIGAVLQSFSAAAG